MAEPADLLAPPPGAISIGEGFAMTLVQYQGQEAGVNEYHRKPDGTWCRGWVPFIGTPWAEHFKSNPEWQGWTVVSREPLTLQPSIKCRVCGNHGYITGGRWKSEP